MWETARETGVASAASRRQPGIYWSPDPPQRLANERFNIAHSLARIHKANWSLPLAHAVPSPGSLCIYQLSDVGCAESTPELHLAMSI